jgi:hypothetical protein
MKTSLGFASQWIIILPTASSYFQLRHHTSNCVTVLPTVSPCFQLSHRTSNWVNQQDAATSQVYYLSFKYSSTCFLMIGKGMPETCWTVFKRQVINLRSCCILLVDTVGSIKPSFYFFQLPFSSTIQDTNILLTNIYWATLNPYTFERKLHARIKHEENFNFLCFNLYIFL